MSKKAPPERGHCLGMRASRPESRSALVGHDHRVNHVDDAIGLKYVGDGDHGSAAFFVLQFDVLAIVQGDPEFAAFDGR